MAVRSLRARRAARAASARAKSSQRKPTTRWRGERDPGEIDDEESDERPFERRDRADGDDFVHLVGAIAGQRESAAEDEEAGEPGPKAERGGAPRAVLGAVETEQALGRHGERRFARHGAASRLRPARILRRETWPRALEPGRACVERLQTGQRVHRYSQVSLIGLPSASSTRRNSHGRLVARIDLEQDPIGFYIRRQDRSE